MKIKPIFTWHDIWLGAHWNKDKRHLDVMIPFVGLRFDFSKDELKDDFKKYLKLRKADDKPQATSEAVQCVIIWMTNDMSIKDMRTMAEYLTASADHEEHSNGKP